MKKNGDMKFDNEYNFLGMSIKTKELSKNEEERKAQLEAFGFTYEPPEVRAERAKQRAKRKLEK
ncbi:hypothetical protein [Lysinibacillus xylanilyticus]|uniref:hypothetical protein n=1 Tax=Lysinibacillus xylanilyticus TaxID=582475 RepID=UPI0038063599